MYSVLSKQLKASKLAAYAKKIPGLKDKAKQLSDIEDEVKNTIKIIDSMTEEEKIKPELLLEQGFPRRQRIAEQLSRPVAEINQFLGSFLTLRETMLIISSYKKKGIKIPETRDEIMKLISPELKRRLAKFQKFMKVPFDPTQGAGRRPGTRPAQAATQPPKH